MGPAQGSGVSRLKCVLHLQEGAHAAAGGLGCMPAPRSRVVRAGGVRSEVSPGTALSGFAVREELEPLKWRGGTAVTQSW